MSAAFVTRRDGYALAAHGELGATSVRGRLIVEAHELDDVPIRVDEVDLLNVVGSDARSADRLQISFSQGPPIGIQRVDAEREVHYIASPQLLFRPLLTQLGGSIRLDLHDYVDLRPAALEVGAGKGEINRRAISFMPSTPV
jgi:hypothetical protein